METSDKKNPVVRLEVAGEIEAFAKIVPSGVRLSGAPGTPVSGEVKIIPNEKYPFSITEVKAREGKDIVFKLDELSSETEKGYVLHIENTRKETGRYRDTILLKTTSTIKPELQVRVYGSIFDPNAGPPASQDKNLQRFLDAVKKQQEKKAESGEGQGEKKAVLGDGKTFFDQLIKQNQEKKKQAEQDQEKQQEAVEKPAAEQDADSGSSPAK